MDQAPLLVCGGRLISSYKEIQDVTQYIAVKIGPGVEEAKINKSFSQSQSKHH